MMICMNTQHKVSHNLFALKRQLEIHSNRPYTWAEIEAATGIHRNTLSNYASNSTSRLDFDVAARLLDFFAAEGMPITVGDLFTVTRE